MTSVGERRVARNDEWTELDKFCITFTVAFLPLQLALWMSWLHVEASVAVCIAAAVFALVGHAIWRGLPPAMKFLARRGGARPERRRVRAHRQSVSRRARVRRAGARRRRDRAATPPPGVASLHARHRLRGCRAQRDRVRPDGLSRAFVDRRLGRARGARHIATVAAAIEARRDHALTARRRRRTRSGSATRAATTVGPPVAAPTASQLHPDCAGPLGASELAPPSAQSPASHEPAVTTPPLNRIESRLTTP